MKDILIRKLTFRYQMLWALVIWLSPMLLPYVDSVKHGFLSMVIQVLALFVFMDALVFGTTMSETRRVLYLFFYILLSALTVVFSDCMCDFGDYKVAISSNMIWIILLWGVIRGLIEQRRVRKANGPSANPPSEPNQQ